MNTAIALKTLRHFLLRWNWSDISLCELKQLLGSFISVFALCLDEFITSLTTLKSRLGGLHNHHQRLVCSSLMSFFRGGCLYVAYKSLFRCKHVILALWCLSNLQPSANEQGINRAYVNWLRLSLRCLRPGEAISFKHKPELVRRHSRGLSQTCPGVWLSCAQPDQRLFSASG